VLLVEPLHLEPDTPGGVAEALGKSMTLSVERPRLSEVAEVGEHAAEVEIAANAQRRVRLLGDRDAPLQVLETAHVAGGGPRQPDRDQRVSAQIVEPELL